MQKRVRSLNWWFTKIASLVALIYLIVSLSVSVGNSSKNGTSPLKSEHIILFAIILLFNSDLIEKIESFSLGDVSAKFATKEEMTELGEKLDYLVMGTILDAYEFVTLLRVQGSRSDRFSINPSGFALLERLCNRGLIEENVGDKVLNNPQERQVNLRNHFTLTKKGERYLQVVEKMGIGRELEAIVNR